jgi:hypothetical protein
LPDLAIRPERGLFEQSVGLLIGTRRQGAPEGLHHERAGHFSGLVSAHTIGHGQEDALLFDLELTNVALSEEIAPGEVGDDERVLVLDAHLAHVRLSANF